MRPFLKRVGGKTRLLPELKARMPATYRRYFEPFFGGGALFFDLEPRDAVVGDASVELMNTYRGIATSVNSVIRELRGHTAAHAADDYYYTVRDRWNAKLWDDDLTGHAAAFIYLNKTCFNGLWRVNKSGGFNVPKGDYVNPTICDAEALQAAAHVLKRVNLRHTPYDVTTTSATAGDFVYCDPPYDPINKTSNFVAYTTGGFGDVDQERLAEHARELRKRGVSVMLSNNDTPFVRSLYEDFCIDNVKCGRSINSKGNKRGAVDEVIITSYGKTS